MASRLCRGRASSAWICHASGLAPSASVTKASGLSVQRASSRAAESASALASEDIVGAPQQIGVGLADFEGHFLRQRLHDRIHQLIAGELVDGVLTALCPRRMQIAEKVFGEFVARSFWAARWIRRRPALDPIRVAVVRLVRTLFNQAYSPHRPLTAAALLAFAFLAAGHVSPPGSSKDD